MLSFWRGKSLSGFLGLWTLGTRETAGICLEAAMLSAWFSIGDWGQDAFDSPSPAILFCITKISSPGLALALLGSGCYVVSWKGVCMNVSPCMNVYICMFVCGLECVQICMYVEYMFVSVCMYALGMYMGVYVCKCVCVCLYVWSICMDLCVWEHWCIRVWICVCLGNKCV